MLRGLAFTASILLAGALPAAAQGHPAHSGSPHGAHPAIDPATHAALHALLHGTWTGSFSSPQGFSGNVDLAVAHDSLRKLILKLTSAQPLVAGAATGIVVEGDTLRWTQEVSGNPCKATAVVSPATASAAETLQGKMACEQGELLFTLHKKTG